MTKSLKELRKKIKPEVQIAAQEKAANVHYEQAKRELEDNSAELKKCDFCGKVGAFDSMGRQLCADCAYPIPTDDSKADYMAQEGMSLEELYQDAKSMIDGVYEIIEIWDVSGQPFNKKWKKEWLRKARELHGAQPMP